jgi:AAA family ATP:ADP antiporter
VKPTRDWVESITLVRPEERRATLLSFLTAFVLTAAYLVLRPVRDAMASDWSDAEVSALWNLQLVLSEGLDLALAAMAVIGSAVAGLWALVGMYLGRRYRELEPASPVRCR